MSVILSCIVAILILALLIVVHEFGHYIIGRWLGFRVLEFAVGFGPKLIKWERKDIKYSIRAIPLGGFCAFAGEDEDNPDDPRAMNNMPWYKRIAVLFAGAGFNILFALIIGFVLFWSAGYQSATISSIEPGTPIAATQATAGDKIVAINGEKITTANQLSELLAKAASDNTATLTLSRDGEEFDIVSSFYQDNNYSAKIEFEVVGTGGPGKIKVNSVDEASDFYGKDIQKGDIVEKINGETFTSANDMYTKITKVADGELTLTLKRGDALVDVTGRLHKTPHSRVGVVLNYANAPMPMGPAFVASIEGGWDLSVQILKFLGNLFTGQADLSQVTGPITTIGTMGDIVGQSAQGGALTLLATVLNLIWAISLNLAIFNLLPIPALDGARMVFVLIEGIRKKPIKRELEGKIHGIGFMVLIGFVVILEISKLFTGLGGAMVWM